MARLPKCPECEYQVDKDTQKHVKHSGKTYHEHCFQQFETRKTHRNELLAYICELYRMPVPNGFMLKQIKEFQETYGYTLKGMQMALFYFHEVLGNSVDGQGIGIIPYIYDETKEYYTKLSAVNQQNMNIEFDNTVEFVKSYYPKPKKRKVIDISQL